MKSGFGYLSIAFFLFLLMFAYRIGIWRLLLKKKKSLLIITIGHMSNRLCTRVAATANEEKVVKRGLF